MFQVALFPTLCCWKGLDLTQLVCFTLEWEEKNTLAVTLGHRAISRKDLSF